MDGLTDFSCSLNGSRESDKCQVAKESTSSHVGSNTLSLIVLPVHIFFATFEGLKSRDE